MGRGVGQPRRPSTATGVTRGRDPAPWLGGSAERPPMSTARIHPGQPFPAASPSLPRTGSSPVAAGLPLRFEGRPRRQRSLSPPPTLAQFHPHHFISFLFLLPAFLPTRSPFSPLTPPISPAPLLVSPVSHDDNHLPLALAAVPPGVLPAPAPPSSQGGTAGPPAARGHSSGARRRGAGAGPSPLRRHGGCQGTLAGGEVLGVWGGRW